MIMNGNTPTHDLGGPEARPLARHDQVAAEREPERAGETCPFAAQMVGFPSCMIVRNRRGKRSVPKCLCTGATSPANWSRLPPAEKTFSVRRGQDHAADALVVAGRLERVDQLTEQLIRERVAGVGLVESDCCDAVRADVVEDRLVGHVAEFYVLARRRRLPAAAHRADGLG